MSSSEQHVMNVKALLDAQNNTMDSLDEMNRLLGDRGISGTERMNEVRWAIDLLGQRALVEATLALVAAQQDANAIAAGPRSGK